MYVATYVVCMYTCILYEGVQNYMLCTCTVFVYMTCTPCMVKYTNLFLPYMYIYLYYIHVVHVCVLYVHA